MDRKKFFKRLAYLILFIFLVNFFANKFYWYSSIWYFDIIMHFLGGFWVGLVFFWLFSIEISLRLVLQIMIGVLLIGVSWEIFEFFFNNYLTQNPFSISDTASDIFFDLFGGLCAILYLWKKLPR